MSALHLEPIPYPDDTAKIFSAFAHWPYAVWLDSSIDRSFPESRYDIFSANPASILMNIDNRVERVDSLGARKPLNQSLSTAIETELATLCADEQDCSLPFVGGAIGYWAYEYNQTKQTHLNARDDRLIDDACIGIYLWAIVIDHREKQAFLVAQPSLALDELNKIRCALQTKTKAETHNREITDSYNFPIAYQPESSQEGYQRNFEAISRYILNGDCYQVNYAERFASAASEKDSFALYCQHRAQLPSPFSAYLNFPKLKVLCHSPERFLKISDNNVSTKPIKGTIARGNSPEKDAQNAHTLKASLKDRAENLMIVDLLRNDLGQLCNTGSVKASKLFELESYPNVHHLVSTIEATKPDELSPLSVFDACFPGGSITGAPKLRAMQIIRELEPKARGVYCGSIGYLSACGNMDSNIAIRTQQINDGTAFCWAGGGLVADSTWESEYNELNTKINKLTAN